MRTEKSRERNMRKILSAVLALCCFAMVHAQYLKPVKVETSLKETSPTEAVITFVASIQPGWHMYSTEEVDGPIPTTLTIETISGAKLEGALKHVTPPIKKYEEMFGTDVYYFEKVCGGRIFEVWCLQRPELHASHIGGFQF